MGQQWKGSGSRRRFFAIPPSVTQHRRSTGRMSSNHRSLFEYSALYVPITAFDKRGIGLSDKFHDAPTLEQRTGDILAVMDAAGLERPALLGVANPVQRSGRIQLMGSDLRGTSSS